MSCIVYMCEKSNVRWKKNTYIIMIVKWLFYSRNISVMPHMGLTECLHQSLLRDTNVCITNNVY